MLRVQQEEYEREKIASLQAQLEEAHKTRSELDTENRFLSSTDRCDGSCSLHTFSLMYFHHLSNVFDLDVNLSFRLIFRLSRERVGELQQQVEDLQKALQSQASKPDDVSLPKWSGVSTEKMQS